MKRVTCVSFAGTSAFSTLLLMMNQRNTVSSRVTPITKTRLGTFTSVEINEFISRFV